jgi:hypothetical protein
MGLAGVISIAGRGPDDGKLAAVNVSFQLMYKWSNRVLSVLRGMAASRVSLELHRPLLENRCVTASHNKTNSNGRYSRPPYLGGGRHVPFSPVQRGLSFLTAATTGSKKRANGKASCSTRKGEFFEDLATDPARTADLTLLPMARLSFRNSGCLLGQIDQIRAMFPHLGPNEVRDDLSRTGSVDETIENILAGRIVVRIFESNTFGCLFWTLTGVDFPRTASRTYACTGVDFFHAAAVENGLVVEGRGSSIAASDQMGRFSRSSSDEPPTT